MKRLGIIVMAGLLTACAGTGQAVLPESGLDRPAAAPVDVGIDWAWRVVGDATVRPVQVFSMNGQTYIQMRGANSTSQTVILVGGEVVPYYAMPPYLMIQGMPNRIDIVSDGYRAVAERTFVQSAPVTVASRAEIMPQDSPVITAHPAEANNNRIERVVIR